MDTQIGHLIGPAPVQRVAIFWDTEVGVVTTIYMLYSSDPLQTCGPPTGLDASETVDKIRATAATYGHVARFKAYMDPSDSTSYIALSELSVEVRPDIGIANESFT